MRCSSSVGFSIHTPGRWDRTLGAWDIPEEKILLVVTVNGANIVKTIKLLQNRQGNTLAPQQPEMAIALNGAAEMSESESDNQ